MSKLINLANTGRTENGDVNFNSTGSNLLDFFSSGGAMLKPNPDFTKKFKSAFAENPTYAVKCLFYFRDIRGGQSVRTNFRDAVSSVSSSNKTFENAIVKNLKHVPEYGRWDDLVDIYFNTKSEVVKKECFTLIAKQLREDLENLAAGKPISLLAKWLPSENCSSAESCRRASHLRELLFPNLSFRAGQRIYRKSLSALRKHIGIVESKMCQNEWEGINFSTVPSKAMFKYRKTFGKKMPEEFTSFIEKAKKGEVKINSSTLFPAEIVKQFLCGRGDDTLEAQWNQLPNYCNDDRNALVVADVSGSMECPDRIPMSCSIALATYFAQRNKGIFKNAYITFTSRPNIIKIDESMSLREIIKFVLNKDVGYDTNLDAVFDLILATAVRNKLPESEMPSTIYVVSDMQFNCMNTNDSAFERMRQKYQKAGYEIPHVVFWQVNGNKPGFPTSMYENGVTLCSGYSPSFFANVAKKNASPIDSMLETLNSERYERIK